MKRKKNKGLAILIAGLVMLSMIGIPKLVMAAEQILMGTAGNFAVLAGQTITNSGPTIIKGDVGVHPGSAFTGLDQVSLNGSVHLADAVALQAQTDLLNAYNHAAGMAEETLIATELGGLTLKPGVYVSASGTFEITGTLTLDAVGDPNAVFIFKTATTLITAPASDVNLINGANLCHVYWKVGSSATLGTDSFFVGRIMADISISLNERAEVHGQLLAMHGSVTLLSNKINISPCINTPFVDVTGSKVWVGGADRPPVQLQLYRNDVAYLPPQAIVHPATSYTWTDVYKTDATGSEYVYTVDEVLVPANYIKTKSEDGLTVTNTYVIPKIDITGTKVWAGGADRPTVQLQLYRDDIAYLPPQAIVYPETSYTWTGLNKTDLDGTAYEYTVNELLVPANYIRSNSEDGLTVTNTYVIPKIDITGTKAWAGGPAVKPDIELQLYRDGVALGDPIKLVHPVTTYQWNDLDKTDGAGKAYIYTIKELTVPGYVTAVNEFDIVNRRIKGNIEFYKLDEMQSGLAAAEFGLYEPTDNGFEHPLMTATSGSDGKVTFSDVEFGNYRIREISAPDGYLKSEKIFNVTIENDGETVVAESGILVNERIKGSIIIFVNDYEGRYVAGAMFTLYHDGVPVGNPEVTDTEGKIIFGDIPYGTYTVKETEVPSGYVLTGDSKEVKVMTEGEEVKVAFTGARIVSEIIIQKVDMNTNKPLAGATFKAVDEDGVKVFEGTTGADGLLSIKLPLGQYILSETKAPKGYKAISKSFSVTITDHGQIFRKTVENEREDVVKLIRTGERPSGLVYMLGALLVVGGVLMMRKKRA